MNLRCGCYHAWSGSLTGSIQLWGESTQVTDTLEILDGIEPVKYNSLLCLDMYHLEVSKRKSDHFCLHFRRSLKTKEFLLTQIHWDLPRRSIPKCFSSLESSFTLSLNPWELMVATRRTNRQMLSLTPMLLRITAARENALWLNAFCIFLRRVILVPSVFFHFNVLFSCNTWLC